MLAADDPLGLRVLDRMRALGFDYVDLSLRDLVALPAAGRDALAVRLRDLGLPCEACNNFFPPEVRLTGPAADLAAAMDYATGAIRAAAQLGAGVIVFGSSGARNVPAGFSPERAWEQLRRLGAALAPVAADHGVTVALEHLNRAESNLVTTVPEAVRLVREVAHPQFRLLVDAYHVRQEDEDPALLRDLGGLIAHVHVAQDAARLFPSGEDAALAAFFAALRASGYRGRISIEAFTRDFAADAARGLRVLRPLAGA
jgi:sugar phosphate isomerase/epimerase